jgi:hypothetical protein
MSSTEIVPTEPTKPAEATEPVVVEVEPPKRRRRGRVVAIVVIALVLLLGVIAFLVGEGFAKEYARDYVRTRIIEVLALPDDADVEVELGGGSIILQALTGRIDSVDVAVPDATFGALAGSVELHAEGVPLDETAAVDVLRVEFAVAEGDLAAIAGSLSGLQLETIELDGSEIVVASSFSIFGIPVPLGMNLQPSAADGQLVFTPTSVKVGENTLAAGDLLANPLFGGFARDLLRQQSVCIASALPQALVVTEAEVDGDELVLTFTGDGAALGGPGLSTLGTCPQ